LLGNGEPLGCAGPRLNSGIDMKKALWLQLPSYGGHQPDTDPAVQLASLRASRFLRRRTPERASEERLYNQQVKEWLRLPENRWCQVYLRLTQEHRRATQCHHYQGRRGMLLLYREFWVPVSMEGHCWINTHHDEARALELLCPQGFYNSPVQLQTAA
jgi:hypothetical protein